jgi:hypothetical protein
MARGIQFMTPGSPGSVVPEIREAIAKGEFSRAHAFDCACAKLDIEQRLTKPEHPWTNGQIERMNRTIKDATVKRFHRDDHAQLRRLRPSLQLRTPTEDPQGPHALRVHLQTPDFRAGKIHPQSTPPNAGTEQVVAPGRKRSWRYAASG